MNDKINEAREFEAAYTEEQRRKDMPVWQQEFGIGYDVPAAITGVMRDTSWGNDMCPTFEPMNQTEAMDPFISLWAEHPDASKREGNVDKRYWVTRAARDFSTVDTLIETDNVAEAVTVALKAVEVVR